MSDAAHRSGRFALIVANSDYVDPKLRKLRAPAADAKRLAAVLADPEIGGYEVEVALDEEQPQLTRRLARFFSNRRPDDLLVVHFSCHGVKDEGGDLYLAAKDTDVGYMLGATGISTAWLRQQIDRSRSKRILVLMDCCYSGSAPFGMHHRAGEDVNVKDHLEGRGRAVITASNATEYSYEGDQLSGEGQPSIFTDAVVEGLESGKADLDGDHWISVDELYEYVYDRVRDKTPNQNPAKLSTLEGPMHIARSSYEPPIEPAKLDPRLLELVEHPVAGARLGAVDELSQLSRSANKGVALAAELMLKRMVDDDSRRVAERAQETLARLAAEQEHARLEAEEQARREAEEQARREAEEQETSHPEAKKPSSRGSARVGASTARKRTSMRREVEVAMVSLEKRIEEANQAVLPFQDYVGRGAYVSYKDLKAALGAVLRDAQKTNKAVFKDLFKQDSAVLSVKPRQLEAAKPAARRVRRAAASTPVNRHDVLGAMARLEKSLDEAKQAVLSLQDCVGSGASAAYKELIAALNGVRRDAARTNVAAVRDWENLRAALLDSPPRP